jgi:CRP-like cAMP-binding protein
LGADALNALLRAGRVMEYTGGHTLIEEGTYGTVFYVIISGKVEIHKHTDIGPRQIDTLSAGHCFGEMALLLNRPREADVVVSGPLTVFELDAPAFEQHIKANATILSALHALVIKRLLNQEKRLLARLPEANAGHPELKVFVSYARLDQAFVLRLVQDLRRAGIDLWLDQREIGAGSWWTDAIEQALEDCTLMVLVLSPNSVDSRVVTDEWHYFLEESKPIVPVIFQPCRVPFRLRRIQHVNFAGVDYDLALAELLERLLF